MKHLIKLNMISEPHNLEMQRWNFVLIKDDYFSAGMLQDSYYKSELWFGPESRRKLKDNYLTFGFIFRVLKWVNFFLLCQLLIQFLGGFECAFNQECIKMFLFIRGHAFNQYYCITNISEWHNNKRREKQKFTDWETEYSYSMLNSMYLIIDAWGQV